MKQSSTASKNRKAKSGSSGKADNKGAGNKPQSSTSRSQNNERSSNRGNEKNTSLSSPSARGNQAAGRSGGEKSAEGGGYLQKFFTDQLKDIYYAEQKLTQALSTMKEASTTEELKEAFEDHLHQTERHVRRLEKVFESMGQRPEGKRCEAIEGIIKEVQTIIEETEEGSMTRDAALIIGAQKVEHYEIATYGGLVTLAITMELYDAADLLDKTLIEEETTDLLLTDIAESYINIIAEEEGQESGGEEENGAPPAPLNENTSSPFLKNSLPNWKRNLCPLNSNTRIGYSRAKAFPSPKPAKKGFVMSLI
jgi:ferritin-like metal-binding protein YciE